MKLIAIHEVMTKYEETQAQLKQTPVTWLITGVAGFIGSNLLETLLLLDQHVVGLDNFSTGYQSNLDEVQSLVDQEQWSRFTLMVGDVREFVDCRKACDGVTHVLHQAALGSVPRSLVDPIATNASNVDGFLNMLVAAKDAKVKSFVYAASSSTYGDHPGLPKVEEVIGKPLSPYAVTKYVNELYASVFSTSYDFHSAGLRYFNVFGKRQDPNGAYAAVIPKWISSMISGDAIKINGDGETSRDFCYIDNTVQANILAATSGNKSTTSQVYNVAVGDRVTLNQLFDFIRLALEETGIVYNTPPVMGPFREGDVRHSQADISKARKMLGYEPQYSVLSGLRQAIGWYTGMHKLNR